MTVAALPSSVDQMVRRFRFDEPVYVTRPTLPSLDAFRHKLEIAWEDAWLTNDGVLHNELHAALTRYLGVENLSLCCNGTLALLLAIQAAGIDDGEVITTPFTFPATPHALHWNRIRPVFCDIEERYYTLDPSRIEERIGPETRAILPVHIFGYPCEVEAIQAIADRHGLPVIYDAAHMMGVRKQGRSILEWGDYSILSFHATKLFSTAEGGAIVAPTQASKGQVDLLKNFGIADEHTVIGPGINGKLNELQAAFGLLALEELDEEIANRRKLTEIYRERLRKVPGLVFQDDLPDVDHNYSYFTLLVDADSYGRTRDDLWDALKRCNVVARKYFSPLCSHIPVYASDPSSQPENLPVAERVANQILCLPLYGTLAPDCVETICAILSGLHDVQ